MWEVWLLFQIGFRLQIWELLEKGAKKIGVWVDEEVGGKFVEIKRVGWLHDDVKAILVEHASWKKVIIQTVDGSAKLRLSHIRTFTDYTKPNCPFHEEINTREQLFTSFQLPILTEVILGINQHHSGDFFSQIRGTLEPPIPMDIHSETLNKVRLRRCVCSVEECRVSVGGIHGEKK